MLCYVSLRYAFYCQREKGAIVIATGIKRFPPSNFSLKGIKKTSALI